MNLRVLTVATACATVVGCATHRTPPQPTEGILAPQCHSTPVSAKDLRTFGFAPAANKVVVVRLFRMSCPFCKEDLLRIGSLFQNGTWSKDKVQLALIAYKKEGVEDRKTFDRFMREEISQFGIPLEAAQVVYVDKDYYKLVRTKNSQGDLVLEGWRAVPFSLVFGKDGRLAYRGHFTSTPTDSDRHYKFVTDLLAEQCEPSHLEAGKR